MVVKQLLCLLYSWYKLNRAGKQWLLPTASSRYPLETYWKLNRKLVLFLLVPLYLGVCIRVSFKLISSCSCTTRQKWRTVKPRWQLFVIHSACFVPCLSVQHQSKLHIFTMNLRGLRFLLYLVCSVLSCAPITILQQNQCDISRFR